jgi:hypothetical protein
MRRNRHDVERRITLPAGMELVVPPPAPEDLEDESRPRSGPARVGERAISPPPGDRTETRRAREA